jgi:hypothetical protein
MGYGSESMQEGVVRDAASMATIPLQTVADKAVFTILHPMTVMRIAALVTLAPTVTAGVVSLDRRVLAGSDTGRVELGQMTIPVGTAAGKVVYKDIDPVDLDMGDQLVFELLTASTAGAAILTAVMIPRAETPANQADAVKSA